MINLTRFFLGLTFTSFLFSASAQTDIDTIVYDGLNRLYEFHIPASYDGSEEIPLVFNMHGRGSNSYQQRIYSQMDGVSDLNNFIVVYPNAEFINNLRQWNLSYDVSPPGVWPEMWQALRIKRQSQLQGNVQFHQACYGCPYRSPLAYFVQAEYGAQSLLGQMQ